MAQDQIIDSGFISTFVSLFALFVSAGSFWVSWRAFRRTTKKEEPNVTARVTPVEGQTGWHVVVVTLQSRTNHGYRCDNISIKSPRGARLLKYSEANEQDGYGGPKLHDPLPLERAERLASMRLAVSQAGDQASGEYVSYGRGDTHTETFYAFVPVGVWSFLRIRPALVMKVVFFSSESIERRSVRTIRRQLAQPSKTAQA